MRYVLAPVKNMLRLNAAFDALWSRDMGVPGLGLIHGPSGFGKTTALSAMVARHRAAFVRANSTTTLSSLLDAICHELKVEGRSGSIDTYERLVRYMDEEISKAVLGETLTTTLGSGGGAYAASKTHNEVRLELVRADADMLSATLNQTLLRWVTELHHPGAEPPTVWRKVEAAIDLKAEAEKDQIVAGLGFEPDEAWIKEKYGEGWSKKAAPKPPPPLPIAPNQMQPQPQPQPGPAFAEGDGTDAADHLTDQLETSIRAAQAQLLEPVRRLVAQAQSLEAIRDGLLDLYPEMATAAFAEMLTQAFLAANLAGRAEVQDGR